MNLLRGYGGAKIDKATRRAGFAHRVVVVVNDQDLEKRPGWLLRLVCCMMETSDRREVDVEREAIFVDHIPVVLPPPLP